MKLSIKNPQEEKKESEVEAKFFLEDVGDNKINLKVAIYKDGKKVNNYDYYVLTIREDGVHLFTNINPAFPVPLDRDGKIVVNPTKVY